MINTLRRTDTAPSLASAVLKEKVATRDAEGKTEYGFFYAFRRMVRINHEAKWLYFWGCLGGGYGLSCIRDYLRRLWDCIYPYCTWSIEERP